MGNLYLNRKCTGALVGVHPFGGFNMSGTDSKAGGRDYLLLFMQAKLSSTKIGATTGTSGPKRALLLNLPEKDLDRIYRINKISRKGSDSHPFIV